MTHQLLLPLSLSPQMTADHFCVGSSNQDAWAWIQAWPEWPTPGLVIYGPSGCGKTHLARVFQEKTQALWLDPETISVETPLALLEQNNLFIVDAVDQLLQTIPTVELFLLQLYNLAKEQKGALLFFAHEPPARWGCLLPDLTSRLNTLPVIPVQAPDDTLLTQVLVKLFHDDQLVVSDAVLVYLLRHMERSFASAQKMVRMLNELSLQEKRPITIDLCRRVF